MWAGWKNTRGGKETTNFVETDQARPEGEEERRRGGRRKEEEGRGEGKGTTEGEGREWKGSSDR